MPVAVSAVVLMTTSLSRYWFVADETPRAVTAPAARSTRSSSGTSTLNGRISVVLSIVATSTSVSGRRNYDLDESRPSRQENAATIQRGPSQMPQLPVKPLSRSQQIATTPSAPGQRAIA